MNKWGSEERLKEAEALIEELKEEDCTCKVRVRSEKNAWYSKFISPPLPPVLMLIGLSLYIVVFLVNFVIFGLRHGFNNFYMPGKDLVGYWTINQTILLMWGLGFAPLTIYLIYKLLNLFMPWRLLGVMLRNAGRFALILTLAIVSTPLLMAMMPQFCRNHEDKRNCEDHNCGLLIISGIFWLIEMLFLFVLVAYIIFETAPNSPAAEMLNWRYNSLK